MSDAITSVPEAVRQEDTNLKRAVSLRLTVIARLMRNHFDKNISTRGVTRSQWSLIVVVARNPGASQRTIADALEITEAAAGRLIEKLCSEGLLERRVDKGDKRARRVYLMPAAQPLLEILAKAGMKSEADAFAGITDEELAQFKILLGKVHANLAENKSPLC